MDSSPHLVPRGLVLAINCTTSHAPSSAPTGVQGDHVCIPKGRMRSQLVSSPLAAPSPAKGRRGGSREASHLQPCLRPTLARTTRDFQARLGLTHRCCGSGGCPEPESQGQDPNHQHTLQRGALDAGSLPIRRDQEMSTSQGGVSYKKDPGDLCFKERQSLAQGEGAVMEHKELHKGHPVNPLPL